MFNNVRLLYIFTFLSSLRFDRALWLLYLSEKGMNMAQVGTIESLLHIVIVLFEVPTGMAADLYGRRKSLLISSFISLLYAMFMLIGGHFFIFSLAFAFLGLAVTFQSGADKALLYESLEQEKKTNLYTKISGNLMAISLVALSASQWAGGFMAEFSWNLVYGASLAVGILLVFPLIFIKEPIRLDNQATEQKGVVDSWSTQIKESAKIWREEPTIRVPVILYIFLSCVLVIVFFYGQAFFSELGFSKSDVGLIFTIESLLGITAAKTAFYFERRVKFRSLTISIYLFICLGLLLFGVLTGWGVAVVFFIMGNLSVILEPIFTNYVQARIPSGQRATFFSFINLGSSFAIMILFPVFGAVVDAKNFNLAFSALAFCMGAVLVFCVFYEKKGPVFKAAKDPAERAEERGA